MEALTLYFFAILILDIFLVFTIIFLERKNPEISLAWIVVIITLPVIGALLYAFLSQNIAKRQILKLKKDEEEVITKQLEIQIEKFKNDSFIFSKPEVKTFKELIRLHQVYSNSLFTENNTTQIFTDGIKKFDSLFEDIKNAKSTIHIQYFIIKKSEIANQLFELLIQKAIEGVKVRVLCDAMGSINYPKKLVKRLKEVGGEFATFFPFRFAFINTRANYRNHRKIVVIDGQIGYIGGFNIGDEYVNLSPKLGYWRDTHLRVTGPSIYELQINFLLDWRYASGKDVEFNLEVFPKIKPTGDVSMQIVSSGPDSHYEQIKNGILKMITEADKTIYIQTPYFIPDDSLLDCLKMAILSGIEVNIMIPDKPDHVFVYWATLYNVGLLLEYGANVYIYKGGFLHSKVVIADDMVVSTGSANFDIRSFKLNFETNLFIYDKGVAKQLVKNFKEDIEKSEKLAYETYINRPIGLKIKESVSRLLNPIL